MTVFFKDSFYKTNFRVFLSGSDTPLPDLNIVVTDVDIGKNAEFDLVSNFHIYMVTSSVHGSDGRAAASYLATLGSNPAVFGSIMRWCL